MDGGEARWLHTVLAPRQDWQLGIQLPPQLRIYRYGPDAVTVV